MIFLSFKHKYLQELKDFKGKVREVLRIFQGDRSKFYGFLKVFGITRSDKPIPFYQQKKDIAIKPMEVLDGLICQFATVLDGELTLGKALGATDRLYPLEVQGEHFGSFTLTQLHFLFRMLTKKELGLVYDAIPVSFPNHQWGPSTVEGIKEMEHKTIPSEMKKFTPDKYSQLSILLEPQDDVPLVDLSTLELLRFKTFGAALPPEYKAEITKRRSAFIQAIINVIDQASVFEVEPVMPVGKRILNFIHFGDPKGMEYYPF